MKIRKPILTISLLTFFAIVGPANAAAAEFQFSLAFSPSLPRGEFHDVLGKTAWGGAIGFGFRPSRSPVMIGTSFSFGIYDTDRWEEWLGLTSPDVRVGVRSTNAILAWNLYLRLQPREGFLRPYLDVFAGLHILTTDTRIGEGDSDNDDFGVNNSVDTAFAYGAGGGIQLPVVRFVQQDGRRVFSIDLDFGVRYAMGGRADYLVETDEYGVFDTRTSRTDLLTLSAGLTFVF
jgi:hypothetical protein